MQVRILNTKYIKLENLTGQNRDAVMEEAGALIQAGALVAFPTETVYGLGADGLNAQASKKIYEAKGRPSDNPLIVHIAHMEQVDEIAKDVSLVARKVMEKYWPGPLTVILPKKDCVPDGTTGGLATVAIRMPSHPVARELIEKSGCMIAAPSANSSGRPSPTLAEHVYEDLKGKIPMILDGGAVGIGIESTIVDFTGDKPVILRPGYISEEMLSELVEDISTDPAMKSKTIVKNVVAKAPGMKYRHYAPKGQLILVEGQTAKVIRQINQEVWRKVREGYRVVVLGTEESLPSYVAGYRKSLGSRKDPASIAAAIYRLLRECDDFEADYIYSESFFEGGLGDAIMNRMLKAAGYQLLTLEDA